MNAITPQYVSSSLSTQQGSFELSGETRQFIALGRQYHWGFRILGQAPIPEEPVWLGDWLLVPAQINSSTIPERTLERIDTIFASGIRPQGFVMVHEAPKVLTSSIRTNDDQQEANIQLLPKPTPLEVSTSGEGIIAFITAAVGGMVTVAGALMTFAVSKMF
jgi:hypothetical protein